MFNSLTFQEIDDDVNDYNNALIKTVSDYTDCVNQIKQTYAGGLAAASIKIAQCAKGGAPAVAPAPAPAPNSNSNSLENLRSLLDKFMKFKF